MTKIASNLQIDSARLWDTIHETAKFGATPKGGVRRLTLGPEDKQVRDWFRNACEAAGLDVHVDALGSMFGLRKGRDMSKPPIGLGSHLDTQPTGGKFDGVLGTLAALEVVRTLNDAGIETEMPICIVNWTNEEGSRFAPAMMASAAYVGDFTTDDILSRRDAEGVTVAEALDRIGYRGESAVGTQKFTGFVELHIEQGPILEAEGKTIGVVDSGQGVLWYDGTHHRLREPCRHDADAAAPRRAGDVVGDRAGDGAHCAKARSEGGRHHRRGRDRKVPRATSSPVKSRSRSTAAAPMPRSWTRSTRNCAPRSPRSPPGARSTSRSTWSGASRRPISMPNWSTRWRRPPETLGYSHRRITSGAGHDACNLNTIMPAAMVFVPCKDGVSHNELEDATQADCTAGANVLMHTVLALAGVAS